MASLLDRLRDPSHTGARRCWPCTAANAAILLVACAGVARRRSRSLAAALGAAGAATIALRGYLIPFTPRVAPALVARLPGDPFHATGHPTGRQPVYEASAAPDAPGSLAGSPDASGSLTGDRDASGSLAGDSDADAGEAVLAALLDAGVVSADEETVYLDGGFREAWRTEMRELRRHSHQGLADALREVAPEGTEVDVVERTGRPRRDARDAWFVVSDGSGDPAHEQWLTRPVAVAETAAVRVLADRTVLGDADRVRATGPLRTFLEACPACDGRVAETTVVACCGGPGGARADAPDEVLACTDCGARLYTF